MRKIGLFVMFLIFSNVQAQHHVLGLDIGYQYQTNNWLKLGGYYQHVLGNDLAFKIDANANISKLENWTVVPEIGLSIIPKANEAFAIFGEIEATPYTVTPKIGYSIIHFIDLTAGYGFKTSATKNNLNIKGFSIGIQLNIPLNYKLN